MKSSFGIIPPASSMDVPADILGKMERFCAFQERSEQEVRKKLCATPLSAAQRDDIILRLKADDFLNEHRFVDVFVRSKVKEQWGKYKIRQALFAKGVHAADMEEAINGVDETLYAEMLDNCIDKWKRMHSAVADDRSKLIRFLLTRGYAIDEIMDKIQ